MFRNCEMMGGKWPPLTSRTNRFGARAYLLARPASRAEHVFQVIFSMKKSGFIYASVALAIGMLALGWFLGRQTTLSSARLLAGELFSVQIFNHAYTDVTITQAAIENLNAGRIEDAKQILRAHQDGNIVALDSVPGSPPLTIGEMQTLLDLSAKSESQKGSKRTQANRLLTQIARYRTEHPWTYNGTLPHETNTEVLAQLDTILRRASRSEERVHSKRGPGTTNAP